MKNGLQITWSCKDSVGTAYVMIYSEVNAKKDELKLIFLLKNESGVHYKS